MPLRDRTIDQNRWIAILGQTSLCVSETKMIITHAPLYNFQRLLQNFGCRQKLVGSRVTWRKSFNSKESWLYVVVRVLPLVERTNSSIAICSFYQPKCIHIPMHLQIAICLSSLSDPTCQCNLEFFCEQLQDHLWKNSRDFPIQQRTLIHHLEFSQNWHCSLVWLWNSNIWVGYFCKSLLESYYQRPYSKYSCYQ